MGDNALVKIPDFDRGRGDSSDLLVFVLAIEDEKIVVGTRHGKLREKLERNAVDATKRKAIVVFNVPVAEEYSLRELVRLNSVGTGQRYRRCSCRQRCSTNRCACFKSGLKCNSSCHPRHTGKNRDKFSFQFFFVSTFFSVLIFFFSKFILKNSITRFSFKLHELTSAKNYNFIRTDTSLF